MFTNLLSHSSILLSQKSGGRRVSKGAVCVPCGKALWLWCTYNCPSRALWLWGTYSCPSHAKFVPPETQNGGSIAVPPVNSDHLLETMHIVHQVSMTLTSVLNPKWFNSRDTQQLGLFVGSSAYSEFDWLTSTPSGSIIIRFIL
jgi:hypothetical protein